MPINFVLICSLFTLHTLCLSLLCPTRFEKKKTGVIWFCVILSSTLITFGLLKTLPLVTGAYISIVVTIIPSVMVTFYLSRYCISKTLFLFLTYAQCFWALLFFAGLLSYLFFDGQIIPAATIRSILHIGVVLLCAALRKPVATSMSQRIPKGWWPLDLVAALFAFYLGYLAPRSYAPQITAFALVSFVLLITIIITVYMVFFYTIRYMSESARMKQAELQSTLLLQQIDAMQEAVEATGRARHDMRHHNLLIAQYIEAGQLVELLQYLGEYEKTSESHALPVYCEHLATNNILCVYARKAKSQGIKVRIDTSLKQNTTIHDIDLVIMLANLMENAIYGCIHSRKSEQVIELYIDRKVSKQVIYIRNTAGADIVFENGIPLSVNGEGIGVSSILHSAEKYGGEYDFRLEDGMFCCQLLLKIPRAVVK